MTPEGTEATPVMIHRAVLGSLERFIAILLEHTAGKLPALARAGAGARPAGEREGRGVRAREVAARFARRGSRAEADLRNEKLGYKIREAQLEKIPVHRRRRRARGGRRDGRAAHRRRATNRTVALDAFVARVAAEARMPGGAS